MIQIQAKNIEMTDSIHDYIIKKFDGIDKFIHGGQIDLCSVEITKNSQKHKKGEIYNAEVTIRTQGKKFYAYSHQTDLYKSIDDVRDEIVRELTTNKGKTLRLFRRGARQVKFIIKELF